MNCSILGIDRKLVTSVRDGTVRVDRKERSDKCSPETIQKVTQFYLDEKNSKILPGKKDWVSVKTSNGRVKMRKRFLLSNIGESHLQFVEENGNIISKDMFRKLRPPNVVPTLSGALIKDHSTKISV